MLRYLGQKRGQVILEYAVLIVIIIGALLTIQIYIKRGVQGRLKSAADDIGDQYSDGNTNVIETTHRMGITQESFNAGTTVSEIIGNEATNTVKNSVILNTSQEYWGTDK